MKTAREIFYQKCSYVGNGNVNEEDGVSKIIEAMEEYAQMKVNELNKSDVIKSVCGCWIPDMLKVDKNGICEGCGRKRE